MNPRKIIILLVLVGLLCGLWISANPLGRFGWSRYALTTYNAWPRVISDIQVRTDGTLRQVDKTHDLTFSRIEWLLEPKPEVLIIALGWDGMTDPDERIRGYKGCEVHLLENKEAI